MTTDEEARALLRARRVVAGLSATRRRRTGGPHSVAHLMRRAELYAIERDLLEPSLDDAA